MLTTIDFRDLQTAAIWAIWSFKIVKRIEICQNRL